MKTPAIRLSTVNVVLEAVTGHKLVAQGPGGEEVDVSLHIAQVPNPARMLNPVRVHFPMRRR